MNVESNNFPVLFSALTFAVKAVFILQQVKFAIKTEYFKFWTYFQLPE